MSLVGAKSGKGWSPCHFMLCMPIFKLQHCTKKVNYRVLHPSSLIRDIFCRKHVFLRSVAANPGGITVSVPWSRESSPSTIFLPKSDSNLCSTKRLHPASSAHSARVLKTEEHDGVNTEELPSQAIGSPAAMPRLKEDYLRK